jgi:hypothetical protein
MIIREFVGLPPSPHPSPPRVEGRGGHFMVVTEKRCLVPPSFFEWIEYRLPPCYA